MTSFHIGFIWCIAELRRLDCVLVLTQEAVLASMEQLPKNIDDTMLEATLNQASDQAFHNTSPFTFEKLRDGLENIAVNPDNFINGFSHDARESVLTEYLSLFTKTQAFHKLLQVKVISSTIENVDGKKYVNIRSVFLPCANRCPSSSFLIERTTRIDILIERCETATAVRLFKEC